MDLSFRQGTIDDLQNLKKLGIKSWTPFQKNLTEEHWNSLNKTICAEKTYENLIGQSTCFLCVENNKNVVGMAFLVPHGNPTDIYLTEWSYIRFVSVDPEFGGQGIGKKLTRS